MQILSQGKYQNAEISNLIDQKKYPKEESNYISLIYLYSKIMKPIKYWKRHENWKQQYPHLNGRKSVCSTSENNEEKKAINAMNMALASLDSKIKHRF
jgi:hypothetical protein